MNTTHISRFIVSMIVICTLLVAASATTADYYPADCIPDPSITYTEDEHGPILWYNPQLSMDCVPVTGNDMLHYYELASITYRVERQTRLVGSSYWGTPDVLITQVRVGPELYVLDGGPYYSLLGGINITGESVGEYYRYRLVVTTDGYVASMAGPPYIVVDSFGDTFATDWIPGPDEVEVNDTFDDRPGDVAPPPGHDDGWPDGDSGDGGSSDGERDNPSR